MLGRLYESQNCSIARTLEVVGERWTLLIVRDALLGLHRFDEFLGNLGIARNVLADRLGRLVDNGILERSRYQDRPARWEYHLTERGRELASPVLALMQWGDRHLAGAPGPPRLARHAACDGEVTERHVCANCGPIDGAEISVVPGPGLGAHSPR
jgi:DNA-binding HxlR family transcriptional regulator